MANREIKYELVIDAQRALQQARATGVELTKVEQLVQERNQALQEEFRAEAARLEMARRERTAEEAAQVEVQRRTEAAQQVQRELEELTKRRTALEISGMDDEQERRMALIEAQFAAESERIEQLLQLRLRAGEITRAQLEEQREEFDRLIDAAMRLRVQELEQQFTLATDRIERGGLQAQLAVSSLSRGIESAARFTSSWQSGLRGVLFQVIPLTNRLARMRVELAGKQTLMQAITAALGGPAGMVALLTALGTAAVVAGPRIAGMFRNSREEAERARREYDEALQSIRRFEDRDRQTFTGGPEEAARQLTEAATRAAELRDRIRELERERGPLAFMLDFEAASESVLEITRQRVDVLDDEIAARQRLLDDENALLNQAQEFLRTREQERRIAERQNEIGSESNELIRLRARLEDEMRSDRERALFQAEQQLEADLRLATTTELRTQAEEAHRRRVFEINREFDEREAREAQRHAADRLRREEEIARTIFAARLELMADGLERELTVLRQQEAERLAIVRGSAEAEQLVRQATALRTAAVLAEAAQRRNRLEQESLEFLDGVQDRIRLRAAATEEAREQIEIEALQRRIRRIDEQIAAEEALAAEQRANLKKDSIEEAEFIREMEEGIERLRRERVQAEQDALDAADDRRRRDLQAERDHLQRMQDLDDRRRRVLGESEEVLIRERIASIEAQLAVAARGTQEERVLYEALAEAKIDLLDEVLRKQEELIAAAERYGQTVIAAITDAARHESRISDAAAREEERRFQEREDRLREQLQNREITESEFHDRMALIAEQRMDFEKRLEEDRASFTERLVKNLGNAIIAEGERLLAAVVAQGVAQLLFGQKVQAAAAGATAATMQAIAQASAAAAALVNTATMGAAAGASTASIAAAITAVRGMATAFERGGYVGRRGERGQDEVLTVLGRGEAVLNRHQQRWVEEALRERYGFGLMELFHRVDRPHYMASGGFAGLHEPPRRALSATDNAAQAASDRMERELRALRQSVDDQTQRLDTAIHSAAHATASGVRDAVGDPDAARRLGRTAASRESLTDPRRGRL